MWKIIEGDESLSGLPFASDRPYVWIIKSKGKNFINDMYKDYGSDNFDRDIITLKKIWDRDIKRIISIRDGELQKRKEYNTKKLSFYDEGSRDWNLFKIIIKDIEAEMERNNSGNIWNEIYDEGLSGAKDKNSIMSFWNISRIMSKRLTQDKDTINNITKWNSILRECGYSGFADKSGKGYIHPSEPTQAIFLSRDSFTVIDKILNKDYVNADARLVKIKSISDMVDFLEDEKSDNLYLCSYFLRWLMTPHLYVPPYDPKYLLTGKSPNFINKAFFIDMKDFLFICLKCARKFGINTRFLGNCKELIEAWRKDNIDGTGHDKRYEVLISIYEQIKDED